MIDAEHFICITKGRKVDSMREEGILIDDDATNCKQWIKAGYMSIYLQDKGQDVVLWHTHSTTQQYNDTQ